MKQPVISKETTFAAGFSAPVNSADCDPHASLAVSLPTEDATAASSAAAAPTQHKSKRKRLEDSTASASAADMSIGEVCITERVLFFLITAILLVLVKLQTSR